LQARSGSGSAEHGYLPILVRERSRNESAREPAGHFIAEDERAQDVLSRATFMFGGREDAGQDLHGGLTGDEPQSLA
jgi:hypothetical protein